MKQLYIKPLICALLFFIFSKPLAAQIYTYNDIKKATERLPLDTILAIEFKAAEYFHDLINAYRKSEGLSSLEWSNVFWLASRNHNMWMAENGLLGHIQSKKTSFFSGSDPGDRLRYVFQESCNWSGENCLYNYSYSENKSVNDAAYEIALYSLSQWKKSSGHNKNMLGSHSIQGTSFVIDKNGRVWGTTLFGHCYAISEKIEGHTQFRFTVSGGAPSYTPPQLPTNKKTEDNTTPVNKSPSQKYSSGKTQTILAALIEVTMAGQGVKKRSYFSKAASKHSLYMYHTQTEDVLQEKKSKYYYGTNTRQRLFKSSKGRSIFLSKKQAIQEYTFYQEYSTYSFGIETLEEDIQYWIRTIALEDFKLGGIGVKVGKRKEVVKVAVSIILQPK